VNHFWQEGQLVIDTLKAYHFSARFTTDFKANATGEINFELNADDGYRFYIDGDQKLSTWSRYTEDPQKIRLKTEQGKTYRLVVEYFQQEGKASVRLGVGRFEKVEFTVLAERLKDADAIVFVGGISPQLEGEEMPVNYSGFNGGDRTSILLPKVQTELMKTLKSTGKPVVFVMMTGSAIALPWEARNIPAIVNAWYGGQSAGTAIADVLFGDYNPAGRLPVTFYKSDLDLQGFNDYSMQNRTYRYFKGEPLYPFGYGLSYTTFRYDGLKVPASAQTGKSIPVRVRVTNSGKMDGEEVVQLYVSFPNINIQSPIRSLKGFQRIALKKGESKWVQFQLKPEDLSIIDDQGQPILVRGKVNISVGGGQPTTAMKNTVSATVGIGK
jgi:beta-glucosidase